MDFAVLEPRPTPRTYLRLMMPASLCRFDQRPKPTQLITHSDSIALQPISQFTHDATQIQAAITHGSNSAVPAKYTDASNLSRSHLSQSHLISMTLPMNQQQPGGILDVH